MKIEKVQDFYRQELALLTDESAQCDYLMLLGIKKRQASSIRDDMYRIGGCKTAIWIRIMDEKGKIKFEADSDSLLVNGVLFILEAMYQGKPREEIQACPPRFLDWISELVIYPEIRYNGLWKCYQKLSGDVLDSPD